MKYLVSAEKTFQALHYKSYVIPMISSLRNITLIRAEIQERTYDTFFIFYRIKISDCIKTKHKLYQNRTIYFFLIL